jgi:hypothetical protein
MELLIEKKLGIHVDTIESWHFEYQPKDDLLGEWKGGVKPTKYATSVDLTLFLRSGKERIAVLIEVKFTEDGFSPCGGYKSNGNRDKKFCESEYDESELKTRCYLVKKEGREYFEIMKGAYIKTNTCRCPFADNNQCQRNHAFAKTLVSRGIVDQAYFGVLIHDMNIFIDDKWKRYLTSCLPSEQSYLFTLLAGEVVSVSDDDNYRKYLKDRYLIERLPSVGYKIPELKPMYVTKNQE